MNSTTNQAILIAVEDPVLHPEAMHVAAATGRPVIETTHIGDITRHFHRASAVLIDAAVAAQINNAKRRSRVFLLDSDPGPSDWKTAMAIHAEQAILLPAQAGELLSALGRNDKQIAVAAGHMIGVVGAVGGTGASTLAAALAKRRAVSATTVLIDGVPSSGGIDLLLGVEDAPGARWPDVGVRRGTVQAADVLKALPSTPDSVVVLSTARSTILDPFVLSSQDVSAAIDCFVEADQPIDAIVDLHAEQLDEDLVGRLTHLVLVIPAEVRAVAAARALYLELQQFHVPITCVLRHRGWSGLDVSEVEEILGVEITAEIGSIHKLAKSVEMHGLSGSLPRVLSTACDAVLGEVLA
ncbi:septum site-determining protein Ssd [Corynebacterium crudilactis]|uniref:Septum site determining protein n=1 Tax=Corynebacterium crudilactis TaxID=1652495 RepID=A0A172QX58_9CORY|nr:septum site-determining protein Ssd [Corynebacterium crudilactis]ANE05226.1 septum site determining protein [Corynebacterium crudilactis]